MRSYQHHIGDFNNATRHLTRLERSIYRDLIELYYDTEQQLPEDLEWICRKIIANECSTDVERVLNEFFIKTPDGWYQDRCELEIERYKSCSSQKALAGRASAAKRAEKKQQALSGRSSTVEIPLNDASTNHKPITNNHKPVTNKKNTPRKRDESVSVDYLISAGCDAQVAKDWLAIRKTKKLPLTQTALKTIQSEADKAGVTLANAIEIAASNSWAGFKASWLQNQAAQEAKQPESFIDLHTDRSWADGMTSSFMSGQRIDAQRLLAHD